MQIRKLSALREVNERYIEFLRTGKLSMGVYRLNRGDTDTQQPHAEEEVYFVLSGRALFSVGAGLLPVEPGDILFVSATEEHRFHDIQEDLELLVFFAPPEGSVRP
jgi:mannose-6-phosphate isomerase-like protein (cupin superfamily)